MQTEENTLRLDSILDLVAAEGLKADLETALMDSGDLSIDCGDVDIISTPCLQLLFAAQKAAQQTDKTVHFINSSASFHAATRDLGLADIISIKGEVA